MENAKHHRIAAAFALSVAAAMLYVLSLGPVARLHSKAKLTPEMERFLRSFYSPLAAMAHCNPVTGRLYIWYTFDLWKAPPPY